jgi:hypothetical protein
VTPVFVHVIFGVGHPVAVQLRNSKFPSSIAIVSEDGTTLIVGSTEK